MEFKSDLRTACEQFLKTAAGCQLFQIARRFQMQVQPQLVLQKTLFSVEGLGRQGCCLVYPPNAENKGNSSNEGSFSSLVSTLKMPER